MNKKIEAILNNYDIKMTSNTGYGNIKGYEVNVFYDPLNNIAPLQLAVSSYFNDEQKEKISKDLKNMKIKFFNYEFTKYGILLGLNGFTVGTLVKTLPTTIERIFNCFIENGVLKKENCPICGSEITIENSTKTNLDGAMITMHNECIDRINKEIEKADLDFKETPNNFGRGILGALLGGLIGSIIAFVLYFLGFISAISAVVSVVLGTVFYKKFGGKPNFVMILVVLIITLILQLLTVLGIYVIVTTSLSIEEGLDFVGFKAFNYYINNSTEFSSSFIKDMLFSALFTILGLVCEVGYLKKSVMREGKINSKF